MLLVERRNLPGKRRTTKETLIRPAARLAAASLLLIAIVTLWPLPAQAPLSAATPFTCLPCGEDGLADLALNVVLFVPLGFALALGGFRIPTATLVAAVVTGIVELLQQTVIPGRDATAADLLSNTLGGLLGAILAQQRTRLLFPGHRDAAWFASGWAAFGIVAVALTSWSLEASLRATTWYGQWAPFGGEPEWFDGPIIAVELGRKPLGHWRLSDSDARRKALSRDTVRLAARVVSITPPKELLRVVALADSAGRMVTLSQRGRDLGFTVRTRAAQLYLHPPVFRVRDAFPARAGDTLAIEGRYRRGVARIQNQSNELGTLDGWSLLVPAPVGGVIAAVVSVCWLGFLFAPIGYYGGQLRSSAWAVAPVLVLLGLAVLIAKVGGTPLPAPWEVAVGATGALAGRITYTAVEPQLPTVEAPTPGLHRSFSRPKKHGTDQAEKTAE